MDRNITDRVAVVTGASRGLGAGMAQTFAAHGLRLGLCARTTPDAPEGSDALVASVDVREADAVESFTREVEDRWGGIDLWINNAGVLEPIAPLRDLAPADVERHLAVNVLGVFHGSGSFVRSLRRTRRPGVLLNISSGAARHPYQGWAAYCAGKAAVDRLTEVVALEEAELLRAHSVAPGVIDTDMQELIRSTTAEDFPLVERFRQMKEDDGFATPEEVAKGLLELAFGPTPPTEVVLDLRDVA